MDKEGYSIVLWDRGGRQELAKIPAIGSYGSFPLWLPDGNAVVVRAVKSGTEEWFMVSRDGAIRQLTHFGGGMGLYASLSPDGNYLAFSGFNHNSGATRNLIILNLQTLEAVNTCIPFDYPPPVWSSDSQYLAVQYYDRDKKLTSVVVLDPEERWAVKIYTDSNEGEHKYYHTFPAAWLDTGE